ncbi:hypothetical protein KCU65_g3837, partial [Aureobasidium melanogenum]
MRASDILLPIAAASIVAGSPLVFEERAANTCTIKSIQSVVTKLNPAIATPYCQSLLKISTKTITKTLKPSIPSKHVVTATVHKTVTSTNIFLQPILQPRCGTVDKQQSIVIKHDSIEIIKQHPINFDIVFQQHQKFDDKFIKQYSFYFVLIG